MLAQRGGSLRLVILTITLLLSASAVAQPFPSVLLDEEPVFGPDAEWSHETRVAFADSVGLVVWRSEWRILGRLVSAAGRPLGPMNLYFNGSPQGKSRWSTRADVACSGGNFLVVWEEAYDERGRLMGAIVGLDGRILRRLEVTPLGYAHISPSVVFNRGIFLVTWAEQVDRVSYVYFTRVSPQGAVLDPTPQRVAPTQPIPQEFPDMVCGDSGAMVVYYQAEGGPAEELWGNVVYPDGSILDSAGFLIADTCLPQSPAIAFDGTNYMVSWMLWSQRLATTWVSPEGCVLDSVRVIADGNLTWHYASAAKCDTTLLIWTGRWCVDSVRVWGMRFNGQRVQLDSQPFPISESVYHPGGGSIYACDYLSAGWTGREFAAAWSHPVLPMTSLSTTDPVLRRVSTGGEVLDSAEVVLTRAANYQMEVAVASDGTDFMAVWTNYCIEPDTQKRVYAGRFSASGQPLEPTRIKVGGPGSDEPRIAYGGGCYLIVWEAFPPGVKGIRLSRDGALLDSAPTLLSAEPEGGLDPDVAFCDSVFLVVWEQGPVRGRRVAPDGRILDSVPLLLKLGFGAEGSPQVASDGHSFLVPRAREAAAKFMALRVATSGQILDTAEFLVGRPRYVTEVPRIAYGGGVYLIVGDVCEWSWRVSTEGVVLDTAIHLPFKLGWRSVVSFDGTDLLLVGRSFLPWFYVGSDRINGCRIAPDGRPLDSVPISLTELPDSAIVENVAAALGPAGVLGLVFCSFEEQRYMSSRVRCCVGVTADLSRATVPARRTAPSPSVVRGNLTLRAGAPGVLLDISGRRVLTLQPGENDISRLSPGIYFLRSADSGERTAVRKVIIQR